MDPSPDVALVTGASSGIGAEFARLLAAEGTDLVIAARRRDRLEVLRSELESAHSVRVTVLECDLAEPHGAERLFDAVRHLDRPIGTLINNAGFGTYGPMADQPLATIDAMIQVNVTALTTLARLAAAEMLRRGRGRILNVASFAALQPIPRYAVYSGAKAYVVAFSQALQSELRQTGVGVSTLLPGFTATEFHRVANHRQTWIMRLTTLDARAVAEAGLAGLRQGRIVIVPGAWYKANAVLARLLPRRLASALASAVVTSGNR